MTLNEYQKKAQSFDLTKDTDNHKEHAIFQFIEEVGEVVGVFKRRLRGDYNIDVENYMNSRMTESVFQEDVFRKKLLDELGDAQWGLAAVAASHGITLEEIAQGNIKKLTDRASRSKIKGEGDER